MSDDKTAPKSFILMCLFAVWIAASGYSIAVLAQGEAATGLTAMEKFLGWQGVAGMFALAIFGIGISLPKDSGSRSLSLVPILASVVLIAVVFGLRVL